VAGKATQRLMELKHQLKLGSQQEDTVYALVLSDLVDKDQYLRNVRERRRSKEIISHQEIAKAMEKFNEALAEKMKPLLADDQFCKFKEIEKRWPSWGGRQGEKTPPPIAPGSSPAKAIPPAPGSSSTTPPVPPTT
jgi:hypothetical protein